MKICPNCNKVHTVKGNGGFCCKECERKYDAFIDRITMGGRR